LAEPGKADEEAKMDITDNLGLVFFALLAFAAVLAWANIRLRTGRWWS
jgi:hypothetical protein